MKARATIGLVLACVGALRCRTAAGAAIERDVVVNGGSLKNPIGAGFGWWEGAKDLVASLSANPGTIKNAVVFGPEVAIWNTANSPNPWVFQSAAVLPNEAFAVRFHGTLSAGPGKGQFAVAVSDVNIECDSLNTSTLLYRAPSWSDAEDAAEFPENGNSATAPLGMVMVARENWAEIGIRGHFKRSGTMSLEVDPVGLASFELADQNFTPLTAVATDVANRFQILSRQNAEPGSGPWTYYIRPRTGRTAVPNGLISVVAMFTPGNPAYKSQPSPEGQPVQVDESRATDVVLVSTGELTATVNDTTQHSDDFVIVSTQGNWKRPYTDLTLNWNGTRSIKVGLIAPPANGLTGNVSFDAIGSNPITLNPSRPVTTQMYGNVNSKVIDDCVINVDRDTGRSMAPGRTVLKIPVTVASIWLQATINSTPPRTPRTVPYNNQPSPATVAFPAILSEYPLATDNNLLNNTFPQWLFPDSSPPATPARTLVLIEDGSTVALAATTLPAGLTVSFQAIRDQGDAAVLGFGAPTITPRGPNGAGLTLNACGSFVILAFLDNKDGNGTRDPGEIGVMLPLVAVNEQCTADNSQFPFGRAHVENGGGVLSFVGGAGSDAGPLPQGSAGIELSADVQLLGGGPSMNRGLDTVSVGWIQNVAQQLYSRGTYTELGKNSNPAFDPPLIPGKDIWCVSNSPNPGTFPPGSVPNLISQFPLVDASVAGTIGAGWSPTMIDFYGISSHGFPPGGGETWTAAAQDRPAAPFQLTWPYNSVPPATTLQPPMPTLARAQVDWNFMSYVVGWTNRAPKTYVACAQHPWAFTGDYEVSANGTKPSVSVGPSGAPFSAGACQINAFGAHGECCAPTVDESFGQFFFYADGRRR